jgi:hypothetical protein
MGSDGLAHVSAPDRLTAADHAIIQRHRLAIRAAVAYLDYVCGLSLDRLPPASWPGLPTTPTPQPLPAAEPAREPIEARLW